MGEVGKGLGDEEVYEKYVKGCGKWGNVWGGDYEWEGMGGLMMGGDGDGRWVECVGWGK